MNYNQNNDCFKCNNLNNQDFKYENCHCSCNMNYHNLNDRWSQIPYPGQSEPYEGLEKNAGNWPLYFLNYTCDGTFSTLSNKKIQWNIENPYNIDFKKELIEVERVNENLTTCEIGIAKFWGTGVPVQQWTPIALKLISTYKVSPPMSARILSILQNGISDGFTLCWYHKYYYDLARPVQLNPNFKPLLNTPIFPSYPSGHSVVSGVASTVLSYFFPAEADKLNELAETASISRLYGGIHFKSDLTNGIAMGKQLGHIILKCICNNSCGCCQVIDKPYTEFLDAPITPTYC